MPTGTYTIDASNANEPLDGRYVADVAAEFRALKSKLLVVSPQVSDKGAIAGGADITTPLQLAVTPAVTARRKNINLSPGAYSYTTLTNKSGVTIKGGQLVHKPNSSPETWRLANSYADHQTWELGREYLMAFHNQISSAGGVKGYIYGDSTSFGYGATSPFTPHEVFSAVCMNLGLAFSAIINLGVSGTTSADWDPSVAVADSAASLLIVSYGINDASNSLETFYDTMDAKLTAIRASRNVGSLTIILKASNSVNEWTSGRDQVWGERLNTVYRQLARKHLCYFFDTYALYNDSTTAAYWMDTISASGMNAHIHPTNFGNIWIWGSLAEATVSKSLSQRLYNNVINGNTAHTRMSSGAGPELYPFGISIYRTTSTGWPFDGVVITHKSADAVVFQQIFGYDSSAPIMATRRSTGSLSWSAFTGAVVTMGLLNGWDHYNTALYRAASLTLDADGQVSLSGVIKPGTLTPGTVIMNIGSPYRPTKGLMFDLAVDTGKILASLAPDGNLSLLVVTGTPTYATLSNVRYMPL